MPKQIHLKDIANIGPVEKRNGSKNWKSVYNLLSGIAAEYIVNVLDPKKDGEVQSELNQLFGDAIVSPEDWFRSLYEHDSMDELLDALNFHKDEASYAELAENLSFASNGSKNEIVIGKLSFPFSQRFLKLKEIEGSEYALIYSETSKNPHFISINGPGPNINYVEDAPKALERRNGTQPNLWQPTVHTVDADRFFDLTDNLKNVDKDQKVAISAGIDRNLLIVAGAGSGKTRSLVGRLCYLHLVLGLPLSRMVMLTYMKRATDPLIRSASEQLREAYAKMGIPPSTESINASTIDAFFKKLIETYWADIGFVKKPEFGFDKDDRKIEVLNDVINNNDYRFHNDISIEGLRKQLENHANGLTVNIPGIDNLLRSYVDWQIENNEILEFFCTSCIIMRALENPRSRLKEKICDAYDCILIDEFQDINRLQNMIFSKLYDSTIHFTLVGDDDQTIYTWRGSDVSIIREMGKDKDIRTVYLTVNYRNNPHIVKAGNAVLRNMGDRSKSGMEITSYQTMGSPIRKTFVTAEFQDLANEIRKMYDPSPGADRICVLSRNKGNQALIQKALKDCGIPSVIATNNADNEISDGYRILKALVSIFNKCNVKANYDTLNELASGRYTNMELKLFITGAKDFTDKNPEAAAASRVVALSEYLDVRRHQAFTFEEMVSNYCRAYSEISENNRSSDRTVHDPCLSSFLDFVSKNEWPYPDIAEDVLASIFSRFEKTYLGSRTVYNTDKQDMNTVMISTIHSSKGLEYDTVFLVGMDEYAFPNIKKITKEYEACVNEIKNLEESRRSLNRLRANIDMDTVEELLKECDPKRFDQEFSENIEAMSEELMDIGQDLAALNGQGVGDYIQAYDECIRPMIDSIKNDIRDLNLKKRSIEELYYQCEEKILIGDGRLEEYETEYLALKKKIEEIDSLIAEDERQMYSLKEKIDKLESIDEICYKVTQYFMDIDHLEHMSNLESLLKKEKEERIYEEKRSFYVAISRARKLLYLCTSYGCRPSPFIEIIEQDDIEDYKMTTKHEDDRAESIREFKSLFEEEISKRFPDDRKIEEAASRMMDASSDDQKAICESYIEEFMENHPAFKRLNGEAAGYLRSALELDCIGKTMGTEFNSEVVYNLHRSGEMLVKSHVSKNAERMYADMDLCNDIQKKLYDLKKQKKMKNIPGTSYICKLLDDTNQYSELLTSFKGICIGQYITFSGHWPDMTEDYSDNWDVNRLLTDPNEFIIAALDLSDIRNAAVHECRKEDGADMVPYAIQCLSKIVASYPPSDSETNRPSIQTATADRMQSYNGNSDRMNPGRHR